MKFEVSKLEAMLVAEHATITKFELLSAKERQAYFKAFPESSFLDHLKKGALHKDLGIPEDKKIPLSEEEDLKKHGTPLEKKRANFAINQRKWHKHHSAVEISANHKDVAKAHHTLANHHMAQITGNDPESRDHAKKSIYHHNEYEKMTKNMALSPHDLQRAQNIVGK